MKVCVHGVRLQTNRPLKQAPLFSAKWLNYFCTARYWGASF